MRIIPGVAHHAEERCIIIKRETALAGKRRFSFSKYGRKQPENSGSHHSAQNRAGKGEQYLLIGPFCHFLGFADLVQPAALQKGHDLFVALDIVFLFLFFHPDGKPKCNGKQDDRQGNAPPFKKIGQRRPGQQTDHHHQGKNIAEPVKGSDFFCADFFFHKLQISFDQLVKTYAEERAEPQQALDIRIAFPRFP